MFPLRHPARCRGPWGAEFDGRAVHRLKPGSPPCSVYVFTGKYRVEKKQVRKRFVRWRKN
eukprot:535116-Pelagomonas_calceolata.AAC.10